MTLLLTREDAARELSMSLSHFEKFVQSDLRLVRKGRLRLVPASELTRWVEREARFAG